MQDILYFTFYEFIFIKKFSETTRKKQKIKAIGQKLGGICDSLNTCGENMKCSSQGNCECLNGFAKSGSACGKF